MPLPPPQVVARWGDTPLEPDDRERLLRLLFDQPTAQAVAA